MCREKDDSAPFGPDALVLNELAFVRTFVAVIRDTDAHRDHFVEQIRIIFITYGF